VENANKKLTSTEFPALTETLQRIRKPHELYVKAHQRKLFDFVDQEARKNVLFVVT